MSLKQHTEKMSKYIQQKKEELAQATQKSAINTQKKGFLLANIKIQKNGKLH